MKKTLILIALLIVALLGSYYAGLRRGVRTVEKWIAEHTDITEHVDTTSIIAPEPANTLPHDTVYIRVPITVDSGTHITEYVPVHDTTFVEVPVPIVQKTYSDSTYRAVISGPSVSGRGPSLDYIETYNKTVTNTVYVPQKIVQKKDYLEIVGEFAYHNGYEAPVFLNIGHSYKLLDVYAGGGYDFIQKTPVFKVGGKAQIRF